MFLIPKKTKGANVGTKRPTFFRFKKRIFFLISIFSSLNLFDLNVLKCRAKTPYFNPYHEISFSSFFANRSLIFFEKTIFVLDNFIPTLKIFFEKEKISKVIYKKNIFFIFYQKNKKIQILNSRKIIVLGEFYFSSTIIDFKIMEKNKKKILVGFSKCGLVEFWDILSMKLYKIFKLKIREDIFYIKSTTTPTLIYILLRNGQIFSFDILKKTFDQKKKIFLPKKQSEINCISFSFPYFFFLGEKVNYFYNFLNEKKKKIKFSIFFGKKIYGNFIGNSSLFFSIGIFDNFIKIFKFDKKNSEFKLLKEKNGIYSCNEISRIHRINERKILMISKEKLTYLESGSDFSETQFFSKKKKKFSKKVLRNISINIPKKNGGKIFIFINFFKKKKPLFFEIKGKNFQKIFQKNIELPKKVKKIISIRILNFENKIILGCNRNKIIIRDFSNSNKPDYSINQHKNKRKRLHCLITALGVNSKNSYFVSGCSHGTIKLWNENISENSKKLKLHQKIIQVDINYKSELILVLVQNNNIFIIFPETFLLKTVLKGHFEQITDFKYFDYGKFLFTTSLDKTLKIWNLKRKKIAYSYKIEFPIISFEIDEKKNYLISSHHFTGSLGLWSINRKQIELRNPLNFCFEKNGIVGKKKKKVSKKKKKIKDKLLKKKKKIFIDMLHIYKINSDNFFTLEIQDQLKFGEIILNIKNSKKRRNVFINNHNLIFFFIFYLEIFIEDIICSKNIKKNLKYLNFLFKFLEKKKKKNRVIQYLGKNANIELSRIINGIGNIF